LLQAVLKGKFVIDDLKKDAQERMEKSIAALGSAFNKIRTGRAHPSILDGIMVSYYGVPTPLSQVANISVEDARTLAVSPWEKPMVIEVEKAIMKSDLGVNPATNGDLIRIPMPALTEETRKTYIRQARSEAENARVSVRSIRRDVLNDVKELLKEKEISEDQDRKAQDDIQKITDGFVGRVDKALAEKETALMEI
jgi:ribosome recycling factor